MRVSEKTFKAMPSKLQALFVKFPNPGSEEVVGLFPETKSTLSMRGERSGSIYGGGKGPSGPNTERGHNDSGSAARFFYTAKASKRERGEGNNHPTVKPLKLMEYLCKLITPPGGTILDPFMGSGSTLIAAKRLGFNSIGIDLEEGYCDIAIKRLEASLDKDNIDKPKEMSQKGG